MSAARVEPGQLFITGTARSGSTLLLRMLAAHPRLALASDPFLFFFKLLRDVVLGGPATGDEPLQDFYYRPGRAEQLTALLAADLDLPFAHDAWQANLPHTLTRLALENPSLRDGASGLAGHTFQKVMDSALALMASLGDGSPAWVGFKEVWVCPFLPALARSYPQARFLVIQRDPRGVAASLLGLARRDPSQMAHLVSYLRHWRLQAALLTRFQEEPLLAGRLLMVRYEDLVRQPRALAQELCSFLELEPDPGLADASRWRGGDGQVWTGNPASGEPLYRVAPEMAQGWRASLAPETLKLVELVCWPDMELFGYQPLSGDPASLPRDPQVALTYARQEQGRFSWRSDQGQPVLELGAELTRRLLLELPTEALTSSLVEAAFLFPEIHASLRTIQLRHAASGHLLQPLCQGR